MCHFKKTTLSLLTLLVIFLSINPSALSQQLQLVLEGINDASLTDGTGLFQIGASSGTNLVMDRNEILARNNGTNSTLFLNIEGGGVKTGNEAMPSDLWVTGYTKLGNDVNVPNIKTRLVTGTIASSGTITQIAHGLPDQTKILSTSLLIEEDLSGQPYYSHQQIIWHDQTNVTAASNLTNSKTYKLFIVYSN